MFSDPLTLSIISMIVGMVAGAALAALAVLISNDLHRDDPVIYPTEDDMDQMCLWYDAEYGQMCLWYDAEYGQKGAHEK